MRAEIKQLHQRLGTTTIFVTHDQVEAMTMADRIVVMNAGRVEQIGSPLELYDRPQNLFVAAFIGSPSMNLLAGVVRRESSRAMLAAHGIEVPLPAQVASTGSEEVVLGIRPEHVTLDQDGLPARVLVLEPTGSETHVVLELGDTQIVAALRARISAQPGETIRISMPGQDLHLFDRQSGQRIEGTLS